MAANTDITVYYQNCRGIRTKLHTLYMNILSCSYDVIILTETWLAPNIHDSEFIDERYMVFRCDRDRSATGKSDGGGVLIAVRRELYPTRTSSQFACAEIEQVMICLPASESNKQHLISAVYMPPRTSDVVYANYLDMLQDIVNDPLTSSFFIVGDFNLPTVDWQNCGSHVSTYSTTVIGQHLINFMSVTNSLQFNRLRNSLGRILDLFISNINCQTMACSALLDPDSHHPQFSVTSCLNIKFTPMKCRSNTRYNYHKANYDSINGDLNRIDWNGMLAHLPAEKAVNVFYNVLNGVTKSHVPLTRKANSNFPVWFSPGLIRIFKNKERAWTRWKKYSNNYDYTNFSKYRRLFHKESTKCFRHYISTVEDSIPTNIKHFWSYISNRKGKSNYPANMYFKDVSSGNPTEICNLFSSFFSSVYESSTLDPNSWQPTNLYLDRAPCLSDIYITKDDVHRVLKSLDSSKGAGPDGLPPYLFIKIADTIYIALYIIFNKCLREGVFPAMWKRAFITPIYKSGDKSNVENYRPISILSTLSKIFERLVHGVLYPCIHHLIVAEQHGFVKKRSTVTNLMTFTNNLFSNMDCRVEVDAVYTDFQKAFDKVDHTILLEKLAFNGIRGNLLRWFVSYIFNRTQKVVINGFESDCKVVESGVPQGSILGPLLFIVFINDIKCCFANSQFLMYADDIKIYKSCKSLQDCLLLQDDLNKLHSYCIQNKLFLSLSKCYTISFTKNKNKLNYNYSINGITLNRVNSVRDLGILLDSSLHYDMHIDTVINKAFRMYGFVVRSSRDFVRPSTYILLYKTLIRSQLEYATPIWNPVYRKYSDKLEIVQKKFLRLVNYKFNRPKTPYADLMKHYHVTSLEHRRLLLGTMMLHGLCNNKFDCLDLTNKLFYIVPRTVFQRGVRVYRLFHMNTCKTNAGIRVPLNRLVDDYNTHFMDTDIFSQPSYTFKQKLIEILSNYEIICSF